MADPVTVTGLRQLGAWQAGHLPPVEEVRPGLWSIPLPNPDSGVRYVICYAFELTGGGVALVDPGWRDCHSWSALQDGLRRAGFRPADVRDIVVTHFHPDHLGLADKVALASGAVVRLHEADVPAIPEQPGDLQPTLESTGPWMHAHGATPEEVADFRSDREGLSSFGELRRPTGSLTDGMLLDWPGWRAEVVHTPGHTPGHVCIWLPELGLLLTGDHMLPRITPNVAAFPVSGPDPLGAYLNSLQVTAALGAGEALPAHEYRFAGVSARAHDLARHHEERQQELAAVLDAATAPLTAHQISERLSWYRPYLQIPMGMRRAALAETVAHLTYAAGRSLVRREPLGERSAWVSA